MKKLRSTHLIALIIFSFTFFLGCEKESGKYEKDSDYLLEVTPSNSPIQPQIYFQATTTCEELLNLVKKTPEGMLCFIDSAHFNSVYQCLEDMKDAYNEAWLIAHQGMSNEALETYEESIGFSEDQTLIDFENHLEFNSLRNAIEGQIVQWLENRVLDTLNDPDNHPILDEELRTLLTPDCKIKIKGVVYDFCNSDNAENQAMLCFFGCCSFGDEKRFFNYMVNGNVDLSRRFKVKVSLKNIPAVLHLAQAKVVTYKQKDNGNWRRTRTLKRIQVGGDGRGGPNDECDIIGPLGSFKQERRRHLATRFKQWFRPSIWAQNNDIFGAANIDNGFQLGSVFLLF